MCRPDFVIDATFDLFCELCATDEQCDFPVVYASGVNGIAGGSPTDLSDDLAPLFEAIVQEVSLCCLLEVPIPSVSSSCAITRIHLNSNVKQVEVWKRAG